ncbi:MAG: cytochrome C oxidase subunit IV family protein [Acidobacteria bacterium]|nr:cytochrome C oxidase subunit IV family protein [Acidobacteriota bacterium]
MALTSHDPIPTSELDGAVRDYSRDKVYVLTALFLGLVTVVEILTYAFPDFPAWSGNLVIAVLMILMAVKFFTVVYIFMHLRFDKPLLSWVFWSGLVLAACVYMVMLCTFRIFWPGQHG